MEEEEPMGDDAVLVDEDALQVVQQMDGVVTCEIKGLYKDNGSVHNRIYLHNNPPQFVIESSDGSSAEFMVTKNLSDQLERMFGDVHRAYNGIDPTVKKYNSFGEWVKGNVFLVVLLSLMIVFALVAIIFEV